MANIVMVSRHCEPAGAAIHVQRYARSDKFGIVVVYIFAGSSNGRTSPSGGEYLGSSPRPAAGEQSESCCRSEQTILLAY